MISGVKSGLGVVQGHWKWYQAKAWVWSPIAFHSNYNRIFSHFNTIHERTW